MTVMWLSRKSMKMTRNSETISKSWSHSVLSQSMMFQWCSIWWWLWKDYILTWNCMLKNTTRKHGFPNQMTEMGSPEMQDILQKNGTFFKGKLFLIFGFAQFTHFSHCTNFAHFARFVSLDLLIFFLNWKRFIWNKYFLVPWMVTTRQTILANLGIRALIVILGRSAMKEIFTKQLMFSVMKMLAKWLKCTSLTEEKIYEKKVTSTPNSIRNWRISAKITMMNLTR